MLLNFFLPEVAGIMFLQLFLFTGVLLNHFRMKQKLKKQRLLVEIMAPLNFPVAMWSHNSTATYALLQQPSNWSQLPFLWWLLLYLLHWRSSGTAWIETKAALMENNRSMKQATTESSQKCELQWILVACPTSTCSQLLSHPQAATNHFYPPRTAFFVQNYHLFIKLGKLYSD